LAAPAAPVLRRSLRHAPVVPVAPAVAPAAEPVGPAVASAPAPVDGHLPRRSERLAQASPAASSVAPARIGRRAPIGDLARVLATVTVVATIRDASRRSRAPWVILAAPAYAVPPPGLRSCQTVRAPPRASNIGGRRLGGMADRARLISLLSRNRTPLLEPRSSLRLDQTLLLPGSVSHPVPAKPAMLSAAWPNPLTYPLYATERRSRTDPKSETYDPELPSTRLCLQASQVWREAVRQPLVRSLLDWLNTLNDKGLEQSAAPYYEDNAAAHGLIISDYVDRVLH
jgi:hypothetical protein